LCDEIGAPEYSHRAQLPILNDPRKQPLSGEPRQKSDWAVTARLAIHVLEAHATAAKLERCEVESDIGFWNFQRWLWRQWAHVLPAFPLSGGAIWSASCRRTRWFKSSNRAVQNCTVYANSLKQIDLFVKHNRLTSFYPQNSQN